MGRKDHDAFVYFIQQLQPGFACLFHAADMIELQGVDDIAVMHDHTEHRNRHARIFPRCFTGQRDGLRNPFAITAGNDGDDFHK